MFRLESVRSETKIKCFAGHPTVSAPKLDNISSTMEKNQNEDVDKVKTPTFVFPSAWNWKSSLCRANSIPDIIQGRGRPRWQEPTSLAGADLFAW